MPACSIRKCSNNSKKGFRLFCFPANPPEIRKKWVEFCRRASYASYWTPTPNSRMCEVHFVESQFLISTNKLKKLKPHAVPTIFPCTQIAGPESIKSKSEKLKVSTSQSKNIKKRKYTEQKIKIFVPKSNDSNDAAKPVQTKWFPCIFYPDKDADKEHSNQSAAAPKKVILQKPAFEEAFKQFIGDTKQHNLPVEYPYPEHTDIESNLEHNDIKIDIEHMNRQINPEHMDEKIDPARLDIKIKPEHSDIKIDPEHLDIKIDLELINIKNEQRRAFHFV